MIFHRSCNALFVFNNAGTYEIKNWPFLEIFFQGKVVEIMMLCLWTIIPNINEVPDWSHSSFAFILIFYPVLIWPGSASARFTE